MFYERGKCLRIKEECPWFYLQRTEDETFFLPKKNVLENTTCQYIQYYHSFFTLDASCLSILTK